MFSSSWYWKKKDCVNKVKLRYHVESVYHMEVVVCLLGLFAAQENFLDESPEWLHWSQCLDSSACGVTQIRFWSLSVSCIFPNMRHAAAISVILQGVTRNFSSAMSWNPFCCVIPLMFSCWLHRGAFHVCRSFFEWWHTEACWAINAAVKENIFASL